MSTAPQATGSTPDSVRHLQDIADRIVAQAKPGEQIEAYVSRARETDIRIYEGEIEHFVSAQSEGVGVRIIRNGRTGTSYAGTLDASALEEVLAEARENAELGSVDEWAGLAVPDGVPVVPQELWNEQLERFPTEEKIAIAKRLEKIALAADTRVRVANASSANTSL